MAASSEPIMSYGFDEFVEKYVNIKTKDSMECDLKLIDYGVENENNEAPMSVSIFLSPLHRIINDLETSGEKERNIYNFIMNCTSIMPGFPGGGRAFVRLPIDCNIMEWPTVMSSIQEVFKDFRDSFKFNQNFPNYKDFIKPNKRNESFIKNIDFLTCLPENGGSPQINLAFEYTSRGTPILTLIVDSYWQQAINLFKDVYLKCAEYSFNIEIKSKYNSIIPKGFENLRFIYEDVKNTLKHQKNSSFFSSIYKRSDPNADINTNREKKNIHFISANFSYCEYMSFLHRNAILTKLICKIAKIRNGLDQPIISNYDKIFSEKYTLPSLSSECCDVLKKPLFNLGDSPVFIRLIDKLHIHDSIHSTIRYVTEYGGKTSEVGVYLEKRIFEKRDFIEGNVFVFYGSSEGGFFNNVVKSPLTIALVKPLNNLTLTSSKNIFDPPKPFECNLNSSYIYVSRSIFFDIDQFYEMAGDVFLQPWLQWDSATEKSSQKTFGLGFSEIRPIGDNFNLELCSRKIIPFQPFFEELNFSITTYSIENTFLLESAIPEMLKRIFDELEIRSVNLKILPIILSIWSARSLESFSLEHLISMQKSATPPQKEKKRNNTYRNRVIISPKHFTELEDFKQGKEDFSMTTAEKIYGDRKTLESTSSSMPIRKVRKMYNRSFTEIQYSYREASSDE